MTSPAHVPAAATPTEIPAAIAAAAASGRKVRWGILSTGRIAGHLANFIRRSQTGVLAAVGSRDLAKAREFAAKYEIARCFGSYKELVNAPDVDAIYVATPHHDHTEWAIAAARAGKHVLCEKPLTLTFADAQRVVSAAREAGVFLMEAFAYRCNPQTARVLELIRSGAIGRPIMITATFTFEMPYSATSRVWAPELGGGGILDVGCYPMSVSRLIAGAANGKPFVEPTEWVDVMGQVGEKSRVDEWAYAIVRFPGSIEAHLHCAITRADEKLVRILGTEGGIEIPSPFACSFDGSPSRIILKRPATTPGGAARIEEILVEHHGNGVFATEADAVGAAILAGQKQSPAMTWDDTLGNMRALDTWRHKIGMKYPGEP